MGKNALCSAEKIKMAACADVMQFLRANQFRVQFTLSASVMCKSQQQRELKTSYNGKKRNFYFSD